MWKKLKWVGVPVAVILLSACGSTNNDVEGETAAVSNARDDGYRCEKITVTGSRLPVRKCSTQAQRDRDVREAQQMLNSGKVTSGSGN